MTFTKLTEITGTKICLVVVILLLKFSIFFRSSVEHRFEQEREYQRAMNAVKLERVFAKPLLGSLDGHKDGITVLSKHNGKLSEVASASADGEIRIWDLANRYLLSIILQ